jgi:hypothetical protein
MAKDDAVRITDTIAFIRAATVPTIDNPKRATVADILRDRNNTHRIPDIISPAMSQGHNFAIIGRDQVKEYRHYRRALILIRATLLGAYPNDAALQVSQIADANLSTALGADLNLVTTRLQDLRAKLALLKANPLAFLSANNLQVTGTDASGVKNYSFCFDALSNLYNFMPEATNATWVDVEEQVYHLHVQKFTNLARTNKPGGEWLDVAGSIVAGADLMVTTQLTGCAIVYYLNGATLVAAHVQPTGGTNAETMCTSLRADARLSHAPLQAVTGVFGAQAVKGLDPHNYVKTGYYNYCVGVRAHTWDLYAQQRPRGYGAPEGAAITTWQIT